MGKTFSRLVVAVVAALALLAAPAAAAPAAAHTASADDAVSIILYGVEDEATFITREGEVFVDEEELEELVPAVGDRAVITETLYEDEERTEAVGRNHIECTFTEVVGEFPTEEPDDIADLEYFRISITCSGVVEVFGQGTLTWSGVTSFSLDDLLEEIEFGDELPEQPYITVAITGGTQELIGATGQADIFEEEAPTEDELWSRYEVTLL